MHTYIHKHVYTIGGHVECLEAGVFRADIPTKFKLTPSALQQVRHRHCLQSPTIQQYTNTTSYMTLLLPPYQILLFTTANRPHRPRPNLRLRDGA